MDTVSTIMLNSIKNLFNSSVTTTELSQYCNVSLTAISTLRNNKRPLTAMGLSLALSLYQYAVEHGYKDENAYDFGFQSGVQDIQVNLPVSKLVVAKQPLDLFMNGYLEPFYNFPSSDFNRLELHNSLFIDQKEQCYATSTFKKSFTCGYNGSGPRALIDFLNQYSNASKIELEKYVLDNQFIEYNFSNDSIIVKDTVAEPETMTLFSHDNHLIIALRDHSSSIGTPLGGFSEQPDFSEDAILKRIKTNLDIMRNLYHKDTEIQAVYYVPVFNTPETEQYDLTDAYSHLKSEQYNTILKFKDFQIWTNFAFNQTRGDIFSNDLFTKIFAIINLEYTGNHQSFMKYNKLIRLKIEDPQTFNK